MFVLKSLLHSGVGCNRQPKAFLASTIRNEDTRDEFLVALGEFTYFWIGVVFTLRGLGRA